MKALCAWILIALAVNGHAMEWTEAGVRADDAEPSAPAPRPTDPPQARPPIPTPEQTEPEPPSPPKTVAGLRIDWPSPASPLPKHQVLDKYYSWTPTRHSAEEYDVCEIRVEEDLYGCKHQTTGELLAMVITELREIRRTLSKRVC
jgi:hypothetical protein